MLGLQHDSAVALPEDRRKLTLRLVVVQYLVIAGFVMLAAAFWYFQVVQHPKFREMAENNHQRQLGLRAPRGVIFDRGNTVLVENRDSFVISLVREHTVDVDETMTLLARVVGVEPSAIREALRRHRGEPLYRPVPIVEDATLAQVAAVTARRRDLPGVAGGVRAGASLSGRHDGGARVWLRERGDRGAGGQGRPAGRRRRGPGRARAGVQRAADGAGRRQARGGQQRRARNPDARARCSRSAAGACS